MKINSKILNSLLKDERLKAFVNEEKIEDDFLDFFAKKYCEKTRDYIGDFEEDFLIQDTILTGIYLGFYFDNFSFWIPDKMPELLSFIEEHKLTFVRTTKDFLLTILRVSDVENIYTVKDEILKELTYFCKKNSIDIKSEEYEFITVLFHAFILGASQGRTVTLPLPSRAKISL